MKQSFTEVEYCEYGERTESSGVHSGTQQGRPADCQRTFPEELASYSSYKQQSSQWG